MRNTWEKLLPFEQIALISEGLTAAKVNDIPADLIASHLKYHYAITGKTLGDVAQMVKRITTKGNRKYIALVNHTRKFIVYGRNAEEARHDAQKILDEYYRKNIFVESIEIKSYTKT